jgi:L,D-transpeptidase YcbB
MDKSRVGRLFALALLALMPPASAQAQEQVVVPIPTDTKPAVAHKETPATGAAPSASVTVPETAVVKPIPPTNVQSAGRQNSAPHAPATKPVVSAPPPAAATVIPAPAPATTTTSAPKAATAVPMPPVKTQRSVSRETVPMPRPASAPEPKAAAAAPVPASRPELATQNADEDRSNNTNVVADKPSLSEGDAQVAAKLQETMTDGKQLARRVARASDRAAIVTFYGVRNYAPLWTQDGRLTARAKAVIARLKDAAADGLDPASYRVPEFPAGNPATLAASDITLTASVLTFARHLSDGRIAPSRVYEQVDYGDHTPAAADILKTVSEAGNVDTALDSFNPPGHDFRALKHKLAELRSHSGETSLHIPGGSGIIPGKKDDRVPLLRNRMGQKGESTTYDRTLVRAVQKLQAEHGINPSGIVGPQTLGVLNESKSGSDAVERIIANMERWRWVPRDLGRTYVMVNIPDYTLKLVHQNRVVWRTKIVAGKPETPTPLASATMDSVIVNPSWHVPQSIIQNELLPRYQSDPNIFDRMGLEVKRGRDGNLVVVQPPGVANALGQIKFNFPNKFQVYLHDTPEKRLFKYGRRAFSHGCMRVEDPTKFGELVLRFAMNRQSPNARELQAMFGSEEHVFKLTDQPRVHLTYQTAFVDDAGKLQLRDDIYGFDGRMSDILNGREPRAAATAPPPIPQRDGRAEITNEDLLRRIERRETAFNPPQFNPLRVFDEIFR